MRRILDWISSWTESPSNPIAQDAAITAGLEDRYKPFVRNDAYGVAGWHGPKFTLVEYGRILRRSIQLLVTLGSFATFLSVSTMVVGENKANQWLGYYLPWYAAAVMRALGFEPLEVVGGAKEPQASVLVCNHVSYLDMLVLCVHFFPSFVAKQPIQKLFVWGHVARVMRCTFVSHGSSKREEAGSAVDEIVTKVEQRVRDRTSTKQTGRFQPILIFPEGTTTNGSYLLPFRKGAFVAQVPVQPILLHYQTDRFNPAWESISITTHLLRLMAQPSNHCRMTILPPVVAPSQTTTEEFAKHVRNIMAEAGGFVLSDLVYRDKMEYHTKLREMGYS